MIDVILFVVISICIGSIFRPRLRKFALCLIMAALALEIALIVFYSMG